MSRSTGPAFSLPADLERLAPRRVLPGLLKISPEEAMPATRGFQVDDPEVAERLGRIGQTFLRGYHEALAQPRVDELAGALDRVDQGWRGFAYEGAGMGLALLDWLLPFGRPRGTTRLGAFLRGSARRHRYLVTVGAGWTLARVPRRIGPLLGAFDPVHAWLAVDGYGFHHGFFGWPKAIVERRVPRRLRGYALRAFDQGLGRSLWFVYGASPPRIAETISRFPEGRRGDLWSGVGLACGYAGGVDRGAVAALRSLAGPWTAELAQGAGFAALARAEGEEVTDASERACIVLCGCRAAEAAEVVARLMPGRLPLDDNSVLGDPPTPAYESWRRLVAEAFHQGNPRGRSIQEGGVQ